MYSLKNSYKKIELLVGFETVGQNHEIDFILSCENVDLGRFQQTELKLRPLFLSQGDVEAVAMPNGREMNVTF